MTSDRPELLFVVVYLLLVGTALFLMIREAQGDVDLADVLRLTTLIATIAIAYEAYRRTRNTQRRENTFKMLDRYNSEPMASSRSGAWKILAPNDTIPASEKIYVGKYREADPANYRNIGEVEHFWADLNKLWEGGMLDDDLARALFQQAWCKTWGPLMAKLDHGEPGVLTSGATRFNAYTRDSVLPVGRWFDWKPFNRSDE